MNRCLICFKGVEWSLNGNLVCNKCLTKFEMLEKKFIYEGVEVFILYKYNDYFRELLYRFKGCYDYLLRDAFLVNYLNKIKMMYKKRKILCAPSYKKDDEVRGFNHVKEIAKTLKLEIVDCLSKTKKYKQSNQKFGQRKDIQKYIKIDISKLKEKDKILIFDDVATSLSTIKAIIHLLPTNIDKKVLILASNCRFMENEMV